MHSEIRNRIYEFALERDDFEGWENAVPLLVRLDIRQKLKRPIRQSENSARQFFPLTQVCQLIRKEYRPIWLRNSSIRLKYTDINRCLCTFYGCMHSPITPKLIQISLEDEKEEIINLLPLLHRRMKRKDLKIEVVSHKIIAELAEIHKIDPSECVLCEDELAEGTTTSEELGRTGCVHTDFHFDTIVEMMSENYWYHPCLNRFLNHDDSDWENDITCDKIASVRLDFSTINEGFPTILIEASVNSDIAHEAHDFESMSGLVCDYLALRGLVPVHYSLKFKLVIPFDYEVFQERYKDSDTE